LGKLPLARDAIFTTRTKKNTSLRHPKPKPSFATGIGILGGEGVDNLPKVYPKKNDWTSTTTSNGIRTLLLGRFLMGRFGPNHLPLGGDIHGSNVLMKRIPKVHPMRHRIKSYRYQHRIGMFFHMTIWVFPEMVVPPNHPF